MLEIITWDSIKDKQEVLRRILIEFKEKNRIIYYTNKQSIEEMKDFYTTCFPYLEFSVNKYPQLLFINNLNTNEEIYNSILQLGRDIQIDGETYIFIDIFHNYKEKEFFSMVAKIEQVYPHTHFIVTINKNIFYKVILKQYGD